MNKKMLTYILLGVETISAVFIGVISCIDGQTNIIKILSVFLLLSSVVGILYLFRQNSSKSKMNIVDLIISIVVIFLNRESIGLVFGWEQCPMI